jgi:DNA mismatch repair protein MutS
MALTPLMEQYYKIKEQYKDSILLYRMGDFYETFDDDAKIVSQVLGIALTKRGKTEQMEDIPLAGFPYHALDNYLYKLVKAGYGVAICEQVEDPKLAKGIVKREVVEVVTPGVAISDKILNHKINNFLCSIVVDKNYTGISFSDISTGEFYVFEIENSKLIEQLLFINPAEIIISKKDKPLYESIIARNLPEAKITKLEDWVFTYDYCEELLLKHFNVASLKGFGIDQLELGIIAAGSNLHYLKETQKANLHHITKIMFYNPSDYMLLDNTTKRNLEIIYSIQDYSRQGTLISILDKTLTPQGSRLLKKWISAPLIKLKPIQKRQQVVKFLYENDDIKLKLQNYLREIADLERIVSKISTGKANPREIVALKLSLIQIKNIRELLSNSGNDTIIQILANLNPLEELIEKIQNMLTDSPSATIIDGNVIRPGYFKELDDLRNLSENAKDWLVDYQNKERERTGISSLKVHYNKVFGYYIEITNTHKDKVPSDYIRKQTLVNSERYITEELKDYETKILTSSERIYQIELELFNKLREDILTYVDVIQMNSKMVAMLDCFQSFAQISKENNYVMPIVDESTVIDIKQGRHPVVEKILLPEEHFTPNDVYLDTEKQQIIILTGPNMAGKSVYLRQIAHIVLLAQIGCMVPAEYARIGIVDRIFTRVGASDNIAAGESTFLVEMQEAANIINNATYKSLILLDEIGRGTSTYDGISIAWAITEYIHENPSIAARTIFATHYHELNEMAKLFTRIHNYKVDVKEIDNKVIFLHKVTEGYADHSYGIHVAKMGGLPDWIVNRANEILDHLEGKEQTVINLKRTRIIKMPRKNQETEYSLFEFVDDSIRNDLSQINIDEISPIEALHKLSELKQKINSEYENE